MLNFERHGVAEWVIELVRTSRYFGECEWKCKIIMSNKKDTKGARKSISMEMKVERENNGHRCSENLSGGLR